MERSSELKDLYLKICRAQTEGDFSFFERCFSRQDGVIAVGTDPDEWWEGYDAIIEVFRAQLEEAGGFEILAEDPAAFSQGSAGWAAGNLILKLQDGSELPFRLSVVFQKEPDGWKIVHWHSSTAVSNEELIGQELTT